MKFVKTLDLKILTFGRMTFYDDNKFLSCDGLSLGCKYWSYCAGVSANIKFTKEQYYIISNDVTYINILFMG